MKYDICTLYIANVTKLCHVTNHYHLVRLYDEVYNIPLKSIVRSNTKRTDENNANQNKPKQKI